MIDETAIALRYEALAPVLDERGRRRSAAAEAWTAGRGGVLALTRITGLARSTIGRGLRELAGTAAEEAASDRVRRPGAGRKKLIETDPTLVADLQSLVEPTTRGDPMAPLLWTSRRSRSTRRRKSWLAISRTPAASCGPRGGLEPVRVHDFRIPELGRAVPYGVYDITGNTGWVSVGVDHDTASFAVNAIRSWWRTMG